MKHSPENIVRTLIKSIFLILLIMLFSCKDDSDIRVDQPFTLKYQETIQFDEGSFTLQFVDLLDDSRCPVGAVCVWAGQARVQIKFHHLYHDEFKEVELVLGELLDGQSNTSTWLDYTIELRKVRPYPNLEKSNPSKSDYSIELIIRKTN